MSISQYTFSSPLLSYACPAQTPDTAAWRTLNLATEINEGGSSNTKIEVKGTSGLGCTVSLKSWKGSEAWIQGWLNPNTSTWCCAIDSTDYTCHSGKGEKGGWEATMLCSFGGLDAENEHTITIMNSPGSDSRLLIDSAASNGRSQEEVKPTDFVTIATAAKPASINLVDYYKTTSTSSSSSSTSSSEPTSSSAASYSSEAEESSVSTSTAQSSEPNSSGASENSIKLFLFSALGFLAVMVIAIFAFMFLKSKPKSYEESSSLLKSPKKSRSRSRSKSGIGERRNEKQKRSRKKEYNDEEDQDRSSTTSSSEDEVHVHEPTRGRGRDEDDRYE